MLLRFPDDEETRLQMEALDQLESPAYVLTDGGPEFDGDFKTYYSLGLFINNSLIYNNVYRYVLSQKPIPMKNFFKDKHFWIFVLVIFPLMLYANYAS